MVRPDLYEGGWIGKLPTPELVGLVLSRVSKFMLLSTTLGPAVGEDSALIDLGSCVLAAHSDPITEATYRVGALAIDVASNDVATRGAKPSWALLDVLMPEGSRLSSLAAIIEDASAEARRLGIEIVGGHTEAAPRLNRPIIVATVLGCACRTCAIRTGGARSGDLILQVGPVALEASTVIASDFREAALSNGVPREDLDKALSLFDRLSIAEFAIPLADERLVTSMHDVTEGGLVGALYELAYASGKDVVIDRSKVRVLDLAARVLGRLGLDPLKAMGSGAFIATVPPDLRGRAEETLKSLGAEFSFIGYVGGASAHPKVTVVGGKEEVYSSPPVDEVSLIWSRLTKRQSPT
ncbi:MAG: AIR synthase-related protein [Acidilobus sp.]